MQFEGIYTPIVTPYFDDFTCNEAALEATVEHLIGAGVHGLIVAGTTGEYYAQSMKERVWLMGRMKKLIAGRVPMIVGTGAMRTEESVEYASRAVDAGADALLVAVDDVLERRDEIHRTIAEELQQMRELHTTIF